MTAGWSEHSPALADSLLVAVAVATSAVTVAAIIVLALLARTRRELTTRLRHLEHAHDVERRHVVEEILAAERARIAREMHDVVSHQVSLIAVEAGALQMQATDPAVQATARRMRSHAVKALDELRQMVAVLRVRGIPCLHPEPPATLDDLGRLIQESGIRATAALDLPADLPAHAPRTIYRTVQEALTNIRKHAPGVDVRITGRTAGDYITLAIHNTAGTTPSMTLPSARHGLIGLRERAELLGGTLTTRIEPDGAHTLTISIRHH
ncbi:sensor histidine kinase [Microbacterium sp. SA39]|uniref:sensor histidine kinase n=1 Tax=Microbacterium sp. SA39 TaxID=1263625 RepID=UPI00061EB8F5|nr:histidine kinase [Microbacterium sp. SA39]KJQ54289.1 Nitrate/nitrite sensor protein NarX [Microbacterium sp. SA39]